MKNNNSLFKVLIALSVPAVLFYANSTATTKAFIPNKQSSPGTEIPIAFKVMLIKHTVADYEKWKPAYDAHGSVRKEYGQTDLDLMRGVDNPNQLLIIEKITDVQKAKDFTKLPNLKEAMRKAGVSSIPEFSYYDVIRSNEAKVDTKDRMIVTHRIKDFYTWLKAYNKEGKITRASDGMVDRILARSIDDSNIVHLVFAVTDMAKAKAAITSEAKKKLMMSAGVEGIPTIEFYKQAN